MAVGNTAEAEATETRLSCEICGNERSDPAGTALGRVTGRTFHLRRCPSCRFVFVSDPWLDFAAAYGEDYYRGKGADPKLNYLEEALHPERAVRGHELRGVLSRVAALKPISPETTWLDYGCGMGGLLRTLQANHIAAVGYEQGWAVSSLRDRGLPLLDQLAGNEKRFDVITAIEVIEHTLDPVRLLADLRPLLKPGGLLFMTTGNAAPFQDRLARWPYVTPEVHLSFFEPSNLAMALTKAGFIAAYPGFGPGWADIYRYKVLLTLRRKLTSRMEALVPWTPAARALDSRLHLSAHPVGWAGDE